MEFDGLSWFVAFTVGLGLIGIMLMVYYLFKE